jgi:hypothetical protein
VLRLYNNPWNGLAPLGAVLVGWFCDTGGTELAFGIGGACTLAMTALGGWAIKRPVRSPRPVTSEPASEQLAA